jgi:hypothetical protein
MSDSLYEAFRKAVATVFPHWTPQERSDLRDKSSEEQAEAVRKAAYEKVRTAIEKKALAAPDDWISESEAAVYVGTPPRTLADWRKHGKPSCPPSRSRPVKRDSSQKGLRGRGSHRQRQYQLGELQRWQIEQALRQQMLDTAAAVSSSKPGASLKHPPDEGLRITTVKELFEALAALIRPDGKLVGILRITTLSLEQLQTSFAQGSQVEWLSLHEAMTEREWVDPLERAPWQEGYIATLRATETLSIHMGERTQWSAAAEFAKQLAGDLPDGKPALTRRPFTRTPDGTE